MSEPNEVAEVLRKALDVLRERGLAKRALEDSAGHVCSHGALDVACFGKAEVRPLTRSQSRQAAAEILKAVVGEQWPDRPGGILAFNNHPDTTQDDVERAFEKAIARAEEMVV